MKTTFVAVFFCFISFCCNQGLLGQSLGCENLPQKSSPPTAVSDLASLLSPSKEASLEHQLRQYWDSTSIALIVVTVESLEGSTIEEYANALFTCWGPGGQNDAGVLLIVAPNEREVRIEVGYGLEGILTDAQCKQIIEQDLRPRFREQKFEEGIQAGTDKIIAHLGLMSWEERQELARLNEEAEKRAREKTVQIGIAILGAIACVIFVILLFGVFIRTYRRSKLKTQILGAIGHERQEVTEGFIFIKKLQEDFSEAPHWARLEAQQYLTHAQTALKQAEGLLTESAESLSNNEVKRASLLLHKGNSLIEKALKEVKSTHENLRKKVADMKAQAPVRLKEAQSEVERNIEQLKTYLEKGYRFHKQLNQLATLRETLADYETKLNDKECYRNIYSECPLIQQEARGLMEEIEQALEWHKVINGNLSQVKSESQTLIKDVPVYQQRIDRWKERYPEEFWLPYERELKKLSEKLDSERVQKQVGIINDLNGLKKSKFNQAFLAYSDLLGDVGKLRGLYEELIAQEDLQLQNESLYASELKKSLEETKKVLEAIKDPDVEQSTKKKAKQAITQLHYAQRKASFRLVDWIVIMGLLKKSQELAQTALTLVRTDIESAERRRKKKRDEETRSRRKSSDYSSYTSSFSSYSSSNSSSFGGGGFGGFGGGMSGGAGASGSW